MSGVPCVTAVAMAGGHVHSACSGSSGSATGWMGELASLPSRASASVNLAADRRHAIDQSGRSFPSSDVSPRSRLMAIAQHGRWRTHTSAARPPGAVMNSGSVCRRNSRAVRSVEEYMLRSSRAAKTACRCARRMAESIGSSRPRAFARRHSCTIRSANATSAACASGVCLSPRRESASAGASLPRRARTCASVIASTGRKLPVHVSTPSGGTPLVTKAFLRMASSETVR